MTSKLIQISEELELELIATQHPIYRHISEFPSEKLVGYRAIRSNELITGINIHGVDYLPMLEHSVGFGIQKYRAIMAYRDNATFVIFSLSSAEIHGPFQQSVDTLRDGFITIWFD